MTDIGLGIAFAGLWALLAFAQTSKHMITNSLNSILNLLLIPAAISLLWRIALDFQWWTILIFVVVSLAVGTVAAIFSRRYGRGFMFSFQTLYGLFFGVSAITCWFV